jgi:hypothetical protein
MSNPPCQNSGMKNRIKQFIGPKTEWTITTFGGARLVSLGNGSVELRGGKAHERTAAKEWISLFMHEAVPRIMN